MASLTRREKERCPTAGNRRYWTDAPQCKSSRFYSETGSGTVLHEDCQSTDRPSPEGAGSNTDRHGVPWPKTDVPSRGGPGITSGFDTVRPPMVGSWSVRKSDGKVICEHCTATVAVLKIHALSLVIPQYISCKDSTLSAYLHDNLQPHSGTKDVWAVEEEQSGCDICGAHLSQLKQEAIHLILAREERAKWATPSPAKPLPGTTSTKAAPSSPHLSGSARTHSSSAKPSPGPRSTSSTAPSSPRLSGFTRSQSTQKTHPRRILKPTPAEMDRWVEEQQHLASSISMSSNNGVTIFPYQFSEEFSEGPNETVAVQSSSMAPAILSFLVRAAQKLSLTSRRKGQMSAPSPVSPHPHYSTCYRGIIQRSPPTVPTCLLQAANQLKDAPNFGKVKVVLRVCPSPTVPPSQPQPPILRVDPARRRVTMIDPTTTHNQQPHSNSTPTHVGEAKGHSKTYVFDAAYPPASTQAEVCVGILPDVIRSVVNGEDGCILCFGHGEAGKSHTMMGSDSSSQSLGVIPCAISWFYSHTERRRERTGASLAVSVSAMEVCGEDETLRDLLSGNLQDSPSADLYLFEDPIYGMQIRHHSVVSAPNAERAAFLLDAAIASRHRAGRPMSGARGDITTPSSSSSSHMFFTLHVQQQLTEGSGKVPEGHSRLIMIDLANSIKGTSRTSDSRAGRPESELGSVILALLNNGNKNIPNRDSKVTMLLQESLGNINCRTTVLAHVTDSPEHFPETLSTVQIASRIRRTQKKANHSTSCSPSGRSLSRERSGGSSPFSLRAFHSTNAVDYDLSDLPLLRLGGDLLDDHSSSDQSCDTVIHINPDGSVQQPGAELTEQGQGQPEFIPIIHSLHQNKAEAESEDAELSALKKELLQHLLNIMPRLQGEKKKNESIIQEQLSQNTAEVGQCERNLSLKCDTFAELQERLGCIDGSETVTKSLLKEPSAMTESPPEPQDGSGRTEAEEYTSFLKLLNMKVKCCELSIVGEKESLVTDGSLPVDSFQREDSGLYDCEEGSAASSKEDQPNPCGSISIHPACQNQGNPSEYSFLPQHSDIYTQISPVPSSHPPLSLLPLSLEPAGYPGMSGLLQHQTRTSPAGKSTPISPSLSPSLLSPSSSTTSSLATSVLLGEMILPQLSKLPTIESDLKEMKATITVMVQQPLDQTGQDELVFTMVEEVTISRALERGGRAGNIIRIRDAHSSSGQASSGSVLGSLPIRIISNISEDSTGSTIKAMDPVTTTKTMAVEVNTKPKAMSSLSRMENRVLPSFINPSLADLSRSSDAEGFRHRRGVSNTRFTRADAYAEPEKKDHLKGSGSKTAMETEGAFYITERNHEKNTNESVLMPFPGQTNSIASCDTHAWEETGCYEMMSLENRARGKSGNQAERSYPRGGEFTTCSLTCYDRVLPVPSSLITPKSPGDSSERSMNTPENCIPGYLAATHHRTASLPRGWHNINKQESYVMSEEYKDKAPDFTSSTPGSPWVTLEKRPSSARQGIFSCARESLPLPFSPARKYSLEQQQRQRTSNSPLSTASSSPLEPMPSAWSVRHDSGKLESPIEESSRLFSAKLEQLASRTNSLGRIPLEFHTLDRGSSQSSVSSLGSSKGSKGSWEGESCQPTLPRASRSPRRATRYIPLTDKNTPYTAHSPKTNRSTFITEPNTTTSTALQSPRTSRSKLSAVGKLMMTSPKVRRISIPSTKNLSFSPKAFRQSINRSASLSPDGKSPEHGPPWSTQSLSRNQTPSPQTLPPRLIAKSPVRVINGRISELLQIGREPYPSGGASGGLVLDKMAAAAGAACRSMGEVHPVHAVPSPYARVTAPRRPNHLSGHASDVTSVLSGELPPAMGSHPRHLSNDTCQSLRRSASGPRSRWVDRGISEAYEIKVYEIDDVERLQRRGGAGKQGIVCFSAKLKFLEHRQQRIEEVRAKYNSLKRELVLAKQNLMLEPGKWNQEFDLWQTFEVDSLEHLEALEVVTARLESKVNLCKANVMMVTCFDVATKRRQARRRRRTEQQQGFMGI
ncbi:kinesin-like protein KIF26B isoform X2 [Salvelinus fontinalis]|uniref:kinesin-like protein KIF26B isoform X2 n=1 Tax=Salvelinus fontinalis TaxID=8038 RepID=UPI002486568F|nr:kinesin-like protein KIF26B isoform X2 [Salvelinus fontinalis]